MFLSSLAGLFKSQSQRDCILQPSVDAQRLRWVRGH